MTQEDKQLLLTDLCARLPYGVNVAFQVANNAPDIRIFKGKDYDYLKHYHFIDEFTNCTYKPYLRPMSSMTKEERHEFECYIPSCYWKKIGVEKEDTGIGFIPICEFFDNDKGIKNLYNVLDIRLIDWLDRKMFDYRGLIPKGLALEAPEDMYNF